MSKKIFLSLLTLTLFVRLIAAWVIPAGFDEAYYAMWSRYLSWGYFDHPPFVALTAAIGPTLFNNLSPFTIRIGPLCFHLLASYLLYTLCLLNFNKTSARIACVLFNIIPYFSLGSGLLLLPDNSLLCFLLAALLCLHTLRQTPTKRWPLMIAGSLFGLAFLSKYHAVLFILATLLSFWPNNTINIWKRWDFYLGILLCTLIILPNIYWNYAHDWISYIEQVGKGGEIHFSWATFGQSFGGQLAYLLPWTPIFILFFSLKNKVIRKHWLFPYAWVTILVFCIVGSYRSILPHWPMPGWMIALCFLAYQISQWKPWQKLSFITGTTLITVSLAGLLIIQSHYDLLKIPAGTDPTLAGQGWKEVLKKIETDPSLSYDFLISHKWFTGGQLAFASAGKTPVLVFNKNAAHHFAFINNHRSFKHKNAIFITSEASAYDAKKELAPYFNQINTLPATHINRRFSKGQTFQLWYCQNYQGNFPFNYGINKDIPSPKPSIAYTKTK
ncbi:MAG: glycosyltransferase family 39 protein [bacterium]